MLLLCACELRELPQEQRQASVLTGLRSLSRDLESLTWGVSVLMSAFWQETIELLQPAEGPQLVSRPTLKPDLLQKVPFKFLHDVISAVSAPNVRCDAFTLSHSWLRVVDMSLQLPVRREVPQQLARHGA